MALEDLMKKLNELNEKLNSIGEQVSEAINNGMNSFNQSMDGITDQINEAANQMLETEKEVKKELEKCSLNPEILQKNDESVQMKLDFETGKVVPDILEKEPLQREGIVVSETEDTSVKEITEPINVEKENKDA